MFLSIAGILVGILAIVDSIFQVFARTFVQGHEVQTARQPWRTILRVGEFLLGGAFIGLSIYHLTR
jgi:hypothetical protein